MGVWMLSRHVQLLCDTMDHSLQGSSIHGIFQLSTGVGCHFLLRGNLLTLGWNLCLLCFLHSQAGSLPYSALKLYNITLDNCESF